MTVLFLVFLLSLVTQSSGSFRRLRFNEPHHLEVGFNLLERQVCVIECDATHCCNNGGHCIPSGGCCSPAGEVNCVGTPGCCPGACSARNGQPVCSQGCIPPVVDCG